MKALILLPLLLLLLSTSVSSTPPGTRKLGPDVSFKKPVGAWSPIKNLADPHVRQIAEFAISEHNKQANAVELTLSKIAKGDSQVISGINYRLVVVATAGGGAAAQYEAMIWEKPWEKFMKLLSFNQIKS